MKKEFVTMYNKVVGEIEEIDDVYVASVINQTLDGHPIHLGEFRKMETAVSALRAQYWIDKKRGIETK